MHHTIKTLICTMLNFTSKSCRRLQSALGFDNSETFLNNKNAVNLPAALEARVKTVCIIFAFIWPAFKLRWSCGPYAQYIGTIKPLISVFV